MWKNSCKNQTGLLYYFGYLFLPSPCLIATKTIMLNTRIQTWVIDIWIKSPHWTLLSVLSVDLRRAIVNSAALCLCTSGGEGCGKSWPDRCRRRKAEMRWYVRYTLLYGRFLSAAVECYTPSTWVNKFPFNIVCRCGEGRLTLISALISLCRQQAWRGQPLSVHPKAHVNC